MFPTANGQDRLLEEYLDELRGFWRLVNRYERVFEAITHEEADRWRKAALAVVEYLRGLPSDELLNLSNMSSMFLRELVRGAMGFEPDFRHIFIDGIRWM